MTDHILTYLCGSGREVVDLHRERLRTLRDEGFVVHVCAGADEAMDTLAGDGFVVRRLPALGGARNPAAAVLVWSHLIEHPPTLLHGFGPWAPLAALAAQQLHPTVTVVTLDDIASQPWSVPGPLKALQPTGLDLPAWIGRQVDIVFVKNEATQLTLSERIAPEKVHLVVGGDGVVLPEIVGRGGRGIVACTDGLDTEARTRLARVRKSVRKRHPRVDWRNVEAHQLDEALRQADLLVDFGAAGGAPAMHAAAFAVPSVVLRSPDNLHVVENGRTGVVAHDDAGVTKSIVELLDHPKLRKEMGLAARTRAESRFLRRDVDDTIVSLYASTLRDRLGR